MHTNDIVAFLFKLYLFRIYIQVRDDFVVGIVDYEIIVEFQLAFCKLVVKAFACTLTDSKDT